jgi:hypothetical protein
VLNTLAYYRAKLGTTIKSFMMFSGKKSAFNIILIPYLQADNMDDENFKQCLTGRP